MILQNTKKNKGFVILFAVTLSAIILSIALGVANITYRETKFSTSAKDTNNAFFAADTATEYTLFYDKSNNSAFVPDEGTAESWNFVVSGLGGTGDSCANVSIEKDNTNPLLILTTIVSKGYNIGNSLCDSTNPYRVERELKTTYGSGSASTPSVPTSCQTSFYNDRFYVCYFDGILAPTDTSDALDQSTEVTLSSSIGTWSGFNNNWGEGEVGNTGKTDQVSGVWRGRINFQAGDYIFHTNSDDGVELNVDGFGNVISNWTSHSSTQNNSSSITIPAGYRNVQLRFYENTGGAVVGLWWDKD